MLVHLSRESGKETCVKRNKKSYLRTNSGQDAPPTEKMDDIYALLFKRNGISKLGYRKSLRPKPYKANPSNYRFRQLSRVDTVYPSKCHSRVRCVSHITFLPLEGVNLTPVFSQLIV